MQKITYVNSPKIPYFFLMTPLLCLGDYGFTMAKSDIITKQASTTSNKKPEYLVFCLACFNFTWECDRNCCGRRSQRQYFPSYCLQKSKQNCPLCTVYTYLISNSFFCIFNCLHHCYVACHIHIYLITPLFPHNNVVYQCILHTYTYIIIIQPQSQRKSMFYVQSTLEKTNFQGK